MQKFKTIKTCEGHGGNDEERVRQALPGKARFLKGIATKLVGATTAIAALPLRSIRAAW